MMPRTLVACLPRPVPTVPLFFFLACGWIFLAAPAGAGQGGVETLTWDEVVAKYARDYPAVVLEHTYDVEILFDSRLNMSTRITDRRELAVFDVEKAQEHLTLSFLFGPGMKIKNKKAWSMEFRNGVFVSGAAARESDFSVKTVSGGYKNLRVAAPGISHAGYVTYEVEFQSKTPPFYNFIFYNDLPVRYGRCNLHAPSTTAGTGRGIAYMLNQVAIFTRGDVERIEEDSGNREVSMSWEVKDLPPRFDEDLVPVAYQPQASVHVIRADWEWSDLVKVLVDWIDESRAPKHLVKAAKDSLKDRSDQEIVLALARYLDDPARYRLEGSVRSLDLDIPDLETVAREHKGSVFAKGILASRLLRELKVKHHIVLASSQYRSLPNWRAPSFDALDAILLWIPSISPEFLWDVGNPGTPIGVPGADLYEEMLVLDPKADNPVQRFQIEPGLNREIRTLEYVLDAEGGLSGEWTCRFESYPMKRDLNPWDRDADLITGMAAVMPGDFAVQEARWRDVNWDSMRCTRESPAILACRIEHEALPAGDAGWEVRPFYLPLPRRLVALGEGERRGPMLLTGTTEISDRVLMRFDGMSAADLPARVEERNGVGTFYSGWEMKENGVFATRKLTISPGTLSSAQVRQLQALFRAWKDSGEQAVVIE